MKTVKGTWLRKPSRTIASCLSALPIRVAKEAVLTNKLIHRTKYTRSLLCPITAQKIC